MLAFTELVDRWYTQMLKVPRPRLVALIRLGEKIVSLLPAGKSKSRRVGRSVRWRQQGSRELLAPPPSNAGLFDDHRFRTLLSDEDWGRLPLAIWRRFSKRLADGKTIVYVGEVDEACCSRDRLVARAGRARDRRAAADQLRDRRSR